MIDRATITAADAAREFGIPAATVRGWANPPASKEPKLHAVGITRDGADLYPCARIAELAASTRRRAPHTRRTRALVDRQPCGRR